MPDPTQTKSKYLLGRSFAFISLISILGGCFGFVEHQAHSILYDYTDTDILIPKQSSSAESRSRLETKLSEFQLKSSREESSTLKLTTDDLNTLFVESNSALAGNTYLDIANDKIVLNKSISLEGMSGFNGRYINAAIPLEVTLEDASVVLIPDSLSLKGQELPGTSDVYFQALTLNKDLIRDERLESLFQQIKSIEVKNGEVVIQN